MELDYLVVNGTCMNTGKFIEKDCRYYLNKNAPGLSPEESLPVVIDDIKKSISKLSQLSEYLVILYPIPNHAVSTNEVVLRNNLFNESLSYPESIWQDRVKFSKEIYDNIDLDNIIRVYSDELFCNTFIESVAKFGNNIFTMMGIICRQLVQMFIQILYF